MQEVVSLMLGDIDFDPDALRAKYLEERDKRIRDDSNSQYVETKGDFSSYVDDPYEKAVAREPLNDTVEVVIIGGAIDPPEDVSVEDWDRTQGVCLRGVFLGMKHAAAPMRAAGGGSIISTSSIGGLEGSTGLFSYCAAKAAVAHLTSCAALEFARDRIRVNCIAPGGISTPILFGIAGGNKEEVDSGLERVQPYPRVGQPQDIANAALFLASEAAAFITGHTLVVVGGATAGPWTAAPKPGRKRRTRFAGPSFERPPSKRD
jgi:NAD(P)-dependent dehydrogenase (short-subunit alcohol dehydrogenase family)